MLDQLFHKDEVQFEIPYHNKIRRLYYEAFCPHCLKCLQCVDELRAEHKIPPHRDIELVEVAYNPLALKELEQLIGRSNLRGRIEGGLAFPTLIYEGTVRIGVMDKDAYKAFLLTLIYSYPFRPR